jgi:hypothetical protein
MTVPNELPREPRIRDLDQDLNALLGEWRDLCHRCFDEVEQFAQERPAASLAVAFFAGTLFGSFLRRR